MMRKLFTASLALPCLSLRTEVDLHQAGASQEKARKHFVILDYNARLSAERTLDSPSSEPYVLVDANKVDYSQHGQTHKLWDLVFDRIDELRQDGYQPFFVESGAYDGEKQSNTLFMEKSKQWQGLLVEPSDTNYPQLLAKKRKSWSFHGALSPTTKSETLMFEDMGNGLSRDISTALLQKNNIEIPAEPLYSLLQKIQPPVSTVDFWSLDIEGAEGLVLQSTDFSKVEVGVLMIEMNKNAENNQKITAVMDKNGFVDIGKTTYPNGYLDHVFVNPSYFQKRKLEVPQPFGEV